MAKMMRTQQDYIDDLHRETIDAAREADRLRSRIAELERHVAEALRQVDVSDKKNDYVRTILSRALDTAS